MNQWTQLTLTRRGCTLHEGLLAFTVGDHRHEVFETLICRLFRDKVGGYPVRIKITNLDHSALIGIGSNSGGLESA